MIPRGCKRLAEVDFPIAEVSRHSAREKSIRHGHPSTLHLWWARRPLAACRAMLLALLLPDPVDSNCPADFKTAACLALKPPLAQPRGQTDLNLRQALLKFIADFANWDASGETPFLDAARALVRAAHGKEPPLVVDPFAGGGSIPLEALRLGCEVFASDLNPVACLILKVLLEDIPRQGQTLADEVRRVGREIKAQAELELAKFYPPDPDGARPIAYLWTRTVQCESSGCGAEIPLARSFWLAKKEVWGRRRKRRVKLRGRQALRYKMERHRGRPPTIVFEVFEPERDSEVPRGTVSRAKATCPACNIVMSPDQVRAQLSAQRGGADVNFDDEGNRVGGARMLAVVTLGDEERGRRYRLPSEWDYRAVWGAKQALDERFGEQRPGELSPVPDEPLPAVGTLGFRVQRYGMLKWGDLLTARQRLSQTVLRLAIKQLKSASSAAREIASIALSRRADIANSLCVWSVSATQAVHLFGRQAIPMLWDFAETSMFGGQAGDYEVTLATIVRVIEAASPGSRIGQSSLSDAAESLLPAESADVWFTDPPYYDAVPYADLSDFFFVWLKRALPGHPLLRDPFDAENTLTPKEREAVQDETKTFEGQPKDRRFFEEVMARAFASGERVLREDAVGAVVFAHKTTEGWEALLGGMIRGGWMITASWPITTERPGRLRAQESAALAASIHLVCRPRGEDAGVGDWGEIYTALPARIETWMDRLSSEGIRGADLVFACIGPALELFSQYERVETPDGESVGLAANSGARSEPARRGYLSYVWEAVGRAALARVLGTDGGRPGNGGVGALEEDARLTALFLWTVQSTEVSEEEPGAENEDEASDDADDDDEGGSAVGRKKGLTLVYDVARRFAQPLGIHLDQWEGRIIDTDKGVVRLIPVRERAHQLFGEEGAASVAERIEASVHGGQGAVQGDLFPELAGVPRVSGPQRGRRGSAVSAGAAREPETRHDATTLDRVHAAMLLQASGQANALRALLRSEIERGPEYLRLANALSALYPKDGDEKRLLDAMLLGVPRG